MPNKIVSIKRKNYRKRGGSKKNLKINKSLRRKNTKRLRRKRRIKKKSQKSLKSG